MNLEDIKAVYFVGAGGIGMSALVRFFLAKGYKVGGYDKTPSPLTLTKWTTASSRRMKSS